MSQTLQSLGIDLLGIEDRIALVTAIWDSIAEEPQNSLLSDGQRAELDRRLADHIVNPADIVPWETIRTEALVRF